MSCQHPCARARHLALALLFAAPALNTTTPAHAVALNVNGPSGSVAFGTRVHVLPNGNVLVIDTEFSTSVAAIGAIHLLRPDGTRISTVTGSRPGDRVGSGELVIVGDGHAVIRSPSWDSASGVDAGAVTWIHGSNGLNGVVGPSNSLLGTRTNDSIGSGGIVRLDNGHYVVSSPDWNSPTAARVGAVTWGNGNSGRATTVSVTTSLVGSIANDRIGSGGVHALRNGRFVVSSPDADHDAILDAGAVTWFDGAAASAGLLSARASIRGGRNGDRVGYGVRVLDNGHYVVFSPEWDSATATDVGAATWADGTRATATTVSNLNSLVGTRSGDRVGAWGASLRSGHYVVVSSDWANGTSTRAGAVTWCNGNGPTIATVSPTNSLVGSRANDRVGAGDIKALRTGHFVIGSAWWQSAPGVAVGAVTWGNGHGGSAGVVSAANSLIGARANDGVGANEIVPLENGHYVLRSPHWDDGTVADAGAVTWGNGDSGSAGVVSAANSLIGSRSGDRVGEEVAALSTGHYVVGSPYWDLGTVADVGAVTWVDGNGPLSARVGAANSLVGTTADDRIGDVLAALDDAHYVVASARWNSGGVPLAGVAAWISGFASRTGSLSASDSLHGSEFGDVVGSGGVVPLAGGYYIVYSPEWNSATTAGVGAVTLGLPGGATVGTPLTTESVVGTVQDGGFGLNAAFDPLRKQMVVGRPAQNSVVLNRTGNFTTTTITATEPAPSRAGDPVVVRVGVNAFPVPDTGMVQVQAHTGETCVDTTPEPGTGTRAWFSCSIVFDTPGNRGLHAEYLPSIQVHTHAYSHSATVTHGVLVDPDAIFHDGFE